MTNALIYLACSALTLSIIAGVFRVEDARGGKRVALSTVRHLFDRFVWWLHACVVRVQEYVRHSMARLFFHYVAHRILKRLYAITHTLETKAEELLRQNKRTARRIGAHKQARSHLDEIADHKQKTSLTGEQIEKMRSLD